MTKRESAREPVKPRAGGCLADSDRGEVAMAQPVQEIWPEFASNGKENPGQEQGKAETPLSEILEGFQRRMS